MNGTGLIVAIPKREVIEYVPACSHSDLIDDAPAVIEVTTSEET